MHPLPITLSAAVPLWIEEIKRGRIVDFNPDELSLLICEKGDRLLWGGKKKGEAAHIFNELAKGIAFLSFCPGGVSIFNQTYQTDPELLPQEMREKHVEKLDILKNSLNQLSLF